MIKTTTDAKPGLVVHYKGRDESGTTANERNCETHGNSILGARAGAGSGERELSSLRHDAGGRSERELAAAGREPRASLYTRKRLTLAVSRRKIAHYSLGHDAGGCGERQLTATVLHRRVRGGGVLTVRPQRALHPPPRGGGGGGDSVHLAVAAQIEIKSSV